MTPNKEKELEGFIAFRVKDYPADQQERAKEIMRENYEARLWPINLDKAFEAWKAGRAALRAESEPVAWAGHDLDAMAEAFSRVIEAHFHKANPFHSPINDDAKLALRVFRGFIPCMKRYTAPQTLPATNRLSEALDKMVNWEYEIEIRDNVNEAFLRIDATRWYFQDYYGSTYIKGMSHSEAREAAIIGLVEKAISEHRKQTLPIVEREEP